MKAINERPFYSVLDAECATGISRHTWRKWIRDGRIETVKIVRRVLIPRAEIERLIAENTRPRTVPSKAPASTVEPMTAA